MYILINSSFGDVKYLDFKLLEILEAHTHLNNNNKKTLFVHITNIQVVLASSMAGSGSSRGVIRNYPSWALLAFVLASLSGRLSFCGSKMASSSSRFTLCCSAIQPDSVSKRLKIVSV